MSLCSKVVMLSTLVACCCICMYYTPPACLPVCLLVWQGALPEGSAAPCVVINGKALTFSFALDALEVIVQLAQDFIPALPNDKVCWNCRELKGSLLHVPNCTASGSCSVEFDHP